MMLRAPITRDEIRAAIQALHLVLPKFGLTEVTMPSIVDAYRSVMLPLDREAVDGGAKLGLKAWEKFPTPAAWRESIRTWIKHNRIAAPETKEVQRDAVDRAIICKTCRSVARSAWHRRADGSEYSRLIAPCDPAKHAAGDRITGVPENFLMWDERTDAQHYADNHKLPRPA